MAKQKFKKGVRQTIKGRDVIITVVRIGNIKIAIRNYIELKISAPKGKIHDNSKNSSS